jgi:hypothetical protein
MIGNFGDVFWLGLRIAKEKTVAADEGMTSLFLRTTTPAIDKMSKRGMLDRVRVHCKECDIGFCNEIWSWIHLIHSWILVRYLR